MQNSIEITSRLHDAPQRTSRGAAASAPRPEARSVAAPTFFAELKRRKVLRAGALYAAAAWLIVQIATQVFPFFHLPEWLVRWIVVGAAIGFPFVLALAWFYEWTPHGLARDTGVAIETPTPQRRRFDRWIMAVLALAVVLLLTDRFVARRDAADVVVPEKSIAVLPLANESGDAAQDFFSDGLSEELIAALGQLHDLKVIGRNSSFQFRGRTQADASAIGNKLGVATLLEGTVRKVGSRVRIFASLVRASDGSQLWSKTYDREIKDVFAVQSEIATSVAGALKVTLLDAVASDQPPSGNVDAYVAMLQGLFYGDRRNSVDYPKAVASYQRAVSLDPDYAMAYARLAAIEQWYNDWAVATHDEREATRASARAHARKAVELNPNLPEALGALGVTQAWSDGDVNAAAATLEKAVALAPSNAQTLYQFADVKGCLGELEQSVAIMRKVIELDPQNAKYHFYFGQYLLALDRLDEAESAFKRAIELAPTAVGFHLNLVFLYLKRGDADRAMAAAEAESEDGINRREALALAYAARGDEANAKKQLDEMIRLDGDVWPVEIADYYAYRGDKDQALAWMDRGFARHDPSVTSLWQDVMIFPVLRDDPRFAEFCRKAGIPVPKPATAS